MRPNPQETAYLVTFTLENLNRKLHFLCSVTVMHTLKLISLLKQCDALRDLVPFVEFKKNMKNTHGGVQLFVQFQAKSLQLY